MCQRKRRGLRRLKEKLKSSCVSPLFSIFYYNTTSLWYRMCGFSAHQAILQHQVGVVEIYKFILTLFTWRQHQIPQAKGWVSEDGPCPPHFRGQMQVQVVACASDWPAINQSFPGPPPWVQLICLSGSQNSEILYLLGQRLIITGFNSGTDERDT